MFFFFLCINILRIVLQLLNIVLNLCIIKNYTKYKMQFQFDHILCFVFFFTVDVYVSHHWKLLVKPRMLENLAKLTNVLDKTCAMLEIDLVSLKTIGGKK